MASDALAQTFDDPLFVSEVVTSLLPYRLAGLTWAPDGRLFIWTKEGVVQVFKNGVLLPAPFVDLRPHVNVTKDRGLLGLAFHPDFTNNGYVYLWYVYESGGNPNDDSSKSILLTRVTADPSNPDVSLPGSEVIILGSQATTPCSGTTDCIPADSNSHSVGTLKFARDGTLFASLGDAASADLVDARALRAQDLNAWNGKILRIRDDGSAPGDNPFDDGTNSIRSKIWAYGLRNPYRFTLDPLTDEPYIGDGGGTWEEIDRGTRGANFGWSCYEGTGAQPFYQIQFTQCQQLSAASVTAPLYSYPHDVASEAVIAGPVYTATAYPDQYRGNLFLADYAGNWIRRAVFDANGNITSVQSFATDVPSPVSLELGPDGYIYYASFTTGEIRRIRYNDPVAVVSAAPASGYSPLLVSFSSNGSMDPAGGPLSYSWDFGDGSTSTASDPSHMYIASGVVTLTASLTVRTTSDKTASSLRTITLGSQPPTATIGTPVDGTAAVPGMTVFFQGAGNDPDEGLLPATAFNWTVLLHHRNHVHPVLTSSAVTQGSIVVENYGADASYEIILAVTDGAGLSGSASVLLPVSADTTPPTAPSNLIATAEGTSQISLSWTASADNVEVTGYQLERCEGAGCTTFAPIAMPAGTSYSDPGLAASTSYSYRVSATDAANNVSGYSDVSSAVTAAQPPTAPSNLAAAASGGTQINLSWTASTSSTGISSYLVERCQGSGCVNFVQVGNSITTSYGDAVLTPATPYSYRVRASDTNGTLSEYSNTASATTPDTEAPGPPSNLTATPAVSQISLSWTASTDNVGVTGYQLERCQGAGCTTFISIATPATTTYGDAGLTAGISYNYRVRAVDSVGNLSGYSTTATATPIDNVAPAAPTNLAATLGGASVNLSWAASSDNVSVTGYLIERCQGSGCSSFVLVSAAPGTSYSDTGIAWSTTYGYRIRATDAAGNLSGYSGIAYVTTPSYGLEWPGNGAVRRMLYWHNPFPIYDATYVFKVYPRKKTSGPSGYYTTFFWGNDGSFAWDGGNANTYYGMHPYPIPAPAGPGQWEISVNGNDYVTGSEVQWNRWYTQAVRVWRESSSITHHEFYWDWPDTSRVISNTVNDPGWANKNPPIPAIVMGQAPDLNGASWGGYQGWEEFNGIIRGIQIYSGLLSLSDIQAEINAPKSTTAGQNLLWYLNRDPRPGDVTDKKAIGTPHDPSWSGTTALEWADQTAPPDATPPSTPTGLVAAAVSPNQINLSWLASTDNAGVNGYRIERCLGTGCVNFSQIATTTGTSYSDTALAASTSYGYRVRATDAAGNLSGYSNTAGATTLADTTPPVISPVSTANITISGAAVAWTTNEASDSQIIYGYTASYGSSTALITAPVTSHNQVIGGLQPNTIYHYQVLSKDASGNLAASPDFTFTTLADTEPGVPSNGLVSRWKFSEGSGGVTVDAIGSSAGTLTNFACTTLDCNAASGWASAGKFGRAINFDGANDLVNAGNGASLNNLQSFSYSAWIYPRTRGEGNAGRIIEKAGGSGFKRLRVNNSPTNSFYGQVSLSTTSAVAISAASTVSLNQWQHIAMTFDASTATLRIYKNGVQIASGAGSGSPVSESSGALLIGNNAGTTNTFDGLIDDVLIYSRALSPAEIQTLSSASPDVVATAISGVSSTNVTQNSATITWNTNELADSEVNYGLTAGYGSTVPNATLVTAHSVAVPGLSASTTYHYRVDSRDSSGNLSESADFTFLTLPDTTPPAPPSSLTSAAVNSSQINLSWTASTDNSGVTGYRVERCQGAGCSTFAQVAAPADTSYNDLGLAASTSYRYRVRATDAAGNLSGYSNVAVATTNATPDTTPPADPSGLTAAAASSSQINLNWTASTDNVGATGYRVERCQSGGCSNYVQVATPAGPSYNDPGLAASTSYSYRVRATDAASNLSGYSNGAATSTDSLDTTPPTSPTNLLAVASGTSQISLTWTPSTDNTGVSGYTIERCQGTTCINFATVGSSASPSYADAGLSAGTSYNYRLRATDAAGNVGSYSGVASATTLTTPPAGGPAMAYAFNEATGTAAADASGNGWTGTLTNGPGWTTGKNGNAVSFDGVDDKVSLPGAFDIPALPFTLEAWVRPTNRSNWHVIFSKRSSYAANGMRVDIGLQNTDGRVYATTFTSTATFTYAPPLNAWTHLAVVADSTGTRLYVNAVLQQTLGVVTLGTGSTAAVNIGRTGDNDDPFAGQIDDVRLYRRVLTLTDIQTDMNTPVGN